MDGVHYVVKQDENKNRMRHNWIAGRGYLSSVGFSKKKIHFSLKSLFCYTR